jgi:tetratricopeptide (TPR) repeat protein
MTRSLTSALGLLACLALCVSLALADDLAGLSLGQLWQQHRDAVKRDPSVVRYYTFEGVQDADSKVPNLVNPEGALAFCPFEVKGQAPIRDLQIVAGRFAGKNAVRLNQGWLQGNGLDLAGKRFTVECWFRPQGPGGVDSGRGKAGTILSVGTGYWDGWRVVISYPSPLVSFELGRPAPTGAIGVSSADPAQDGLWQHLAATWDGSEIRIFLNGVLTGTQPWVGEYTPARTVPLFKIGYAGYGVGSVIVDVDEVVIYNRALAAEEVRRNAHPELRLTEALTASLRRAQAAQKARNYRAAREEYSRLLAAPTPEGYPEIANFRGVAGLRLADSYRAEGRLEAARAVWTKLANDASGAPPHFGWQARLRLGDSYRDQRDYPAARKVYTALLQAATGQHEHYRLEALERLSDIEGLRAGAPFVDARQRRWRRISSPALAYYVAPTGSDQNPGTRAKPFATLERARDAIRGLKQGKGLPAGGVAVNLRGGVYRRDRTFALTEADSGTEQAPVIYRSCPGEQARLVGGREISGFGPVTDAASLARLPEEARGQVLQCDLKALGVTDYGQLEPRGYDRKEFAAALELIFNGRMMQLARWPNKGFISIADVPGTKTVEFRGDQVETDGKLLYVGDRPRRWAGEKDIILHGYWAVEFADEYQKVKTIDRERRLIEVNPPYPAYGIRKGRPYYALNLLAELDSPGEWYLDRDSGRLYFWPPSAPARRALLGKGPAMVSLLGEPLVTMTRTSGVVLRGLTLEAARGDGIVMREGSGNLVAGCTIRNVGRKGVIVRGGERDGVIGCDIYDVGCGGVLLTGGDRKTLTPAGHFAENNHIYRFGRWERTYQAAIELGGVGCRASHNLIHDGPHHALQVGFNDQVVEYNEVHDVVLEASEMGAYYIWAGLDSFSWRGNVIRYNYFHDLPAFQNYPFAPINTGGPAIHIDAMNGGITLFGNVFAHVDGGAVFNGGGRDNVVENNLFVDCHPSVIMGDRSELYPNWDEGTIPRYNMAEMLKQMPYQQPPWSTRYPTLVKTLEDEPALPKGNVVTRNVSFGGRWLAMWGPAYARPEQMMRSVDNWTDGDPGFLKGDPATLRLRDDAPVWGEIGLEDIPIQRMGLYHDPLRASWPVTHESGTYRQWPTKAPRENVPRYQVRKRTAPITIDGRLDAAEWEGLDTDRALVLEQDPRGLHGAEPRSYAWLAYDGKYLHVGILNDLAPGQKLVIGKDWGLVDSVEIAIEGQSGVNTQGWWMAESLAGPVFFLVGNPAGYFESLDAAGVPQAPAQRLRQATQYAARIISPTQWSAEWKIPWAEACINVAKTTSRPFNIGVRKTAGPPEVEAWTPGKGPAGWVVWVGTGSQNWRVDKAGEIVLKK